MDTLLELLKALLFGIVEGITEWLPISSTGHMILLNEFVTLDVSEAFWDMFLVVIQLGAILAVVVMFWKIIWPLGRNDQKKLVIKKDILGTWVKIIIACIPAIAFVVLGLDDKCDALFYFPIPIAIALILFGIAFILIEKRNAGKESKVGTIKELTWKMALLIGVFQLLAAAFPGTSRSGATILGALLIGVSRKTASEFTFILAIPVMLGASLLEIKDFIEEGTALAGGELGILIVGLVSAFIVSILVIRFLLGYIRKHDFKVFGWYRIALGVIVLLCGAFGII
ncbi:MAG: undecaprenyl-diphosphate phosphatase [Agathobacter sp.]|nr:undecaprenyl-diphosphate phosphatase [Agathobacter sp.]